MGAAAQNRKLDEGGGSLQGEYVTPRVINLMLRYLTYAIELSQTWKLIKPHINDLLTKCVFDLMCFDDEDAELWQEDPQEYIRKVSSHHQAAFDVRT